MEIKEERSTFAAEIDNWYADSVEMTPIKFKPIRQINYKVKKEGNNTIIEFYGDVGEIMLKLKNTKDVKATVTHSNVTLVDIDETTLNFTHKLFKETDQWYKISSIPFPCDDRYGEDRIRTELTIIDPNANVEDFMANIPIFPKTMKGAISIIKCPIIIHMRVSPELPFRMRNDCIYLFYPTANVANIISSDMYVMNELEKMGTLVKIADAKYALPLTELITEPHIVAQRPEGHDGHSLSLHYRNVPTVDRNEINMDVIIINMCDMICNASKGYVCPRFIH